VDSIIKLKHDFKKWWCKIELFRPDIFKNKRVFFLDLDTVILENIDNIVSKKFNFCGLRDFYKNDTLGSGLMSWTSGGYHHIYEKFLRNSQAIMNYTPEGDQQWINQNVDGITYFQDVFGSEIVSYKKHCIKNKIFNMPKNAKIICFHGVPKPHEINYPQIRDHWLP
jgi:alpha-N-acetylglucosamine transferase